MSPRKSAIVYIRLSNTKGEDISVERQLAQAHAHIKQHHLAHNCDTDHFIEPKGHRSGTSTVSRVAFQDAMKAIEQRDDIGYFIVYDLSRFTRGDDLMLLLLKLQKSHIEFVALHDAVDLETPTGRLATRIKGAFNSFYAEDISAKMTQALSDIRAAGGWVGSAPQGLCAIGHGKERHLVLSTETYGDGRRYIDTVIEYFRLYTSARGWGQPHIARELTAAGFRWRGKDGKPKSVYTENLDDVVISNYRGFVDDDLLTAMVARKAERARSQQNGNQPSDEFQPPLLWRIATCSLCKRRYETHLSKHKYRFYGHFTGACENDGEMRDYVLDRQLWDLPPVKRLLNLTDAEKRDIAESIVSQPQPVRVSKHKELRERLSRLEEMRIDGTIDRDKYNLRYGETTHELESLPPEQELISIPHDIDFYLSLMDNMAGLLQNADPFKANRGMRSLFKIVYVCNRRLVDYELADGVEEWLSH